MNRRTMILGGVALVGLGGWAVSRQMGPSSTQITPLAGAANAQTSNADVDTSGVQDMVMGDADAPVTIIEYASYTCPHCANFHNEVFKKLKADYIDTGKVKFVYREVFFDRFGLWASMVARCGGPEKFFGIADLIYKGQSEWTRAGEPAAIVEELRKIGRLAGLNNETLDECLQDASSAETLVAWYEQNAKDDDITSTPSFIIDGKKQSNMAYDDMKKIIDAALES
ncbi:Protein-disulfide isomerase [Sulfitobacter brevis]|uniref:Protein-disulfide isomerase n=1 Tax=Sulfitobacter brevis TaxID=74348 RepID=A0A1I1VXU4_9RHOB|nr:DsbA family protein [Sulfitobacter brevis]SFD85853.1 Protein-disulfide isomerase [Sulfitobacter brevis]